MAKAPTASATSSLPKHLHAPSALTLLLCRTFPSPVFGQWETEPSAHFLHASRTPSQMISDLPLPLKSLKLALQPSSIGRLSYNLFIAAHLVIFAYYYIIFFTLLIVKRFEICLDR